jgi:hypothetical protein
MIGIGSGIKSIGLNAYPTTQRAKALAYHGVRGSRHAKYSVKVSRVSFSAHFFHFAVGDTHTFS